MRRPVNCAVTACGQLLGPIWACQVLDSCREAEGLGKGL